MNLKCNMGRIDQVLRLIIGLVLLYVGFMNTSIINDSLINNILGVLGIINIAASLSRVCPVYYMANISTLPDKES